MSKTDSNLSRWLEQCRIQGYQFAMLRTSIATYDRVAVIDKNNSIMVIEYPLLKKKKGTNKKGTSIKRETIAIRDIVELRYYQD